MDDIRQAIDRLRRSQPRNPDTMAVCDKLLELISQPIAPACLPETLAAIPPSGGRPPFDRKTYQRELMRRRRALAKAKGNKA